MSDHLNLAIDVGTSAVRAAVVDERGEVRGSARIDRADAGGATRFDPERLWRDTEEAVLRIPASERARVGTVAVAGHVGTVFVDGAGHPVGDGYGWAETSGEAVLDEAMGAERAALLAETGRRSAAGAAAAFAHLRSTRPGLADTVAQVLSPKDFLTFRLTGEATTDYTSAAYSGLSATDSRDWSPRMRTIVGLRVDQLPPQLVPTDPVGAVRSSVTEHWGLGARARVAAGTTDGSAGAALVLRRRTDLIADIAGTTDVILRLGSASLEVPPGALITPYPLGGVSVGGPTGATGAALLTWMRLLGVDDVETALLRSAERHREAGPGARGLSLDPSVSGGRFPDWRGGRRGALYGLDEGHDPGDLLLAALEGAAHVVREGTDLLDPSRSLPVALAGGAARSPFLAQLRADLLGRDVEVCLEPDVSLLGAAYLAAHVGGGDPAAFRVGEERTVVRPRAERSAEYDRLHDAWLARFRSGD